ncbi:MAG TPA: glycoside hydrolase family 30 beta sandwich domain-containing protein [Gemmatimonadaceae bacterium]|jgi:glucosylceramidase|nr:glycoside hydrolase family 30 beta sandwich domain-containing protein [Gemmatimonadaceae bacterium]
MQAGLLWRKQRAAALFLVLPAMLSACGHNSPVGPGGGPPPAGPVAQAWITTANQSRLLSQDPDLQIRTTADAFPVVIDVDEATVYQQMIGFGAAMTDASAYLIQHKLGAQRDAILHELFGRNPGIGLSFMRVPMGASDFSTHDYSYDDMPAGQTDSTLAHFSLAEDRVDKLPALKAALAINPDLKLVGSPWSPPGWMKTTGSLIQGTLRPEFYGSFAEYFRKFVDGYVSEGVPIYAVTMQNEPAYEPADYPGMRLDPPARAEVIGKHVGPLFESAGIQALILDWDHNWDMPASPLAVLADSAARKYVNAVAWHCYGGDVSAQENVHAAYPSKDAYFTECSGGGWAPVWADNLKFFVGSLIIGSTRGWAKGIALWNLALDENAGPHLGGCGNCRGVITINSGSGFVTRNVEYYALAHASQFVRPGAHRIASTTNVSGLQSVAFKNSDDGSKILIVLNTGAAEVPFAVHFGGKAILYALPAGAVVTLRWS